MKIWHRHVGRAGAVGCPTAWASPLRHDAILAMLFRTPGLVHPGPQVYRELFAGIQEMLDEEELSTAPTEDVVKSDWWQGVEQLFLTTGESNLRKAHAKHAVSGTPLGPEHSGATNTAQAAPCAAAAAAVPPVCEAQLSDARAGRSSACCTVLRRVYELMDG